jgi:type I restriction enzyme S subunit
MSEWKEYNITEVCDTISDTYRDGADKVILINTSDVLEGKVTNHELVPNKNLQGN